MIDGPFHMVGDPDVGNCPKTKQCRVFRPQGALIQRAIRTRRTECLRGRYHTPSGAWPDVGTVDERRRAGKKNRLPFNCGCHGNIAAQGSRDGKEISVFATFSLNVAVDNRDPVICWLPRKNCGELRIPFYLRVFTLDDHPETDFALFVPLAIQYISERRKYSC